MLLWTNYFSISTLKKCLQTFHPVFHWWFHKSRIINFTFISKFLISFTSRNMENIFYNVQELLHNILAKTCINWCRFLILLVESWRIVIISGTVHWFWLKTSFHPLLWTSSSLTGSWKKLSTYIRFGSLRSVKSVKTRVIGSLRSVESVKPNGNWKPKKFKMCKT